MLSVSTATIFSLPKPHRSGVHYVPAPFIRYLWIARSSYYDEDTQVGILDLDCYRCVQRHLFRS